MTGILQFQSKHGVISVEVDPQQAEAAGGERAGSGLVAKGGSGAVAGAEIVAKASESFDEAMSTLKAYAASVEDLVMDLDLTPKEVSVEIGLKMSGSAGFIIAKADAEAEMKVALTWELSPKAGA